MTITTCKNNTNNNNNNNHKNNALNPKPVFVFAIGGSSHGRPWSKDPTSCWRFWVEGVTTIISTANIVIIARIVVMTITYSMTITIKS